MLRPVLSFSPATLFIVSWRPEKVFGKKILPHYVPSGDSRALQKGGDYFFKTCKPKHSEGADFRRLGMIQYCSPKKLIRMAA
jgi:hypothetical protein